MTKFRSMAWASVPALMAIGIAQYRQAVREIDGHPPGKPVLPGAVRAVPTVWGTGAYRIVEGDPKLAPLLLIHGWGRTGDSAWWPVVWETDRTLVIVDLPGHGRSRLNGRFSFYRASNAVEEVMAHTGIERPIVVGHSMGGAVALETVRRLGADKFSGLIMLASSAYWVRPRLWVTLAAAPVVMGPRSPVLIRRQRSELSQRPDDAGRIVWEYDSRPDRRILDETARCLRSFDARTWTDVDLPPAAWIVTTRDGVIKPGHQRASAHRFGVPTIDIETEHSAVTQSPDLVLDTIEGAIASWLKAPSPVR